MKRITPFLLLLVALVGCVAMVSCTTTQHLLRYTEAQNYFYCGDAPAIGSKKITSQVEFDSIFGMAAFMGKGGEPTKIDFARSFVIAKVLPETDLQTQLRPLSLVKTDANTLTLHYRLLQRGRQSFSTVPMFLLVVDRKYVNCEVVEKVEEAR